MKRLFLAVLILAISQCSASDPGTTPIAAVEGVHLKNEKLSEVISDFESYIEKTMADLSIPGMAVAIVKGDELVYSRGFGVRALNGTEPVTPDTVFQLGSASKAFTAALVAQQVDAGRLNWNDRLIDYLPDFRLYDPWATREFTVTDALSHRSGLPANAGNFLITLGYDGDYAMRALRNIQPVYSFRSASGYSNIFPLWAARLVESLAGKSWEENVETNIFEQLGMNNSSIGLDAYQSAKNVAAGHWVIRAINGSRVVALPENWSYRSWVYTVGPAGGINSNAADMAKWIRMQMNNGSCDGRQIISKKSIDAMHSPYVSDGAGSYEGLGWIYSEYSPYPIIWHDGGTFGQTSMVAFVPGERLGIVILVNAFYLGLPDVLAIRFIDQYFGKPEVDYVARYIENMKAMAEAANVSSSDKDYPPLPLEHYEGNYSSDVYGQAQIIARNGSLTAIMGPRKLELAMEPWIRDTFKITLPDFFGTFSFATFQIDPEGRAESFTMYLFMEPGNVATFERAGS